jgi:hypothetical protein
MIVKLNKEQLDYLNDSLFGKRDASGLNFQINEKKGSILIEIDESMADKIRDWAGDALQKKGFDINYELTREGKLLESLIDAFYVG